MAVKSKEALNEGDKNVGGDESWAMTTNSTSCTDVRGKADGRLLLRMEAPPTRTIGVRVSHVMQRCIGFHIGICTCKDDCAARVCDCGDT